MNRYRTDVTLPDGYELFRRAIVERDDDAWAEVAARYRRLLIAWAGQCSAKVKIAEDGDAIADQALARAWRALSSAEFAAFPNLAALMAYMRACVAAVVIDANRSQAAYERVQQCVTLGDVATPEQLILAQWARAELWRCAIEIAATPQERAILIESFVFELPPRAIQARHADLFPAVDEVYAIKRNLLNRLQRSSAIRELRAEALAV